ncbi:MAG: fumarylacetoacetate hydrolase family protein, partial [Rubricella sp.]
MKLVRYGEAGAERPGILDGDGAIRDLSAHIDDIAGDTLAALADLAALDPAVLPIVEGQPRLGPPVGRIGKVICIGLNYADHAAEAGMDVPAEPIVFMKAPSAITGPNDPIILPRGASKVDWEVELAAVIGARARYVPEASALKHVAGFAAFNDVSERAFQLEHGGQWTKGKSHDG